MYCDAKGFTMFDGFLTEVTIKKLIATRQSVEDKEYEVTTILQGPDGKEHSTQIPILMYKSVEDYEKGQEACYEVCSSPFYIRPNGFSGIDEAWIFVDGEPVTIDIRPLRVVYDYEQRTWTCEGIPQTNIFRTKEECLSFNEYEIVDENGSRTIKGCNALIQLTREQEELVRQFEKLCKKMQDEGILLVSNFCEAFRAYNVRDCQDYEFYFTNEASEDFEQCDRDCGRYVNAQNIYESGDDFELYIKRK